MCGVFFVSMKNVVFCLKDMNKEKCDVFIVWILIFDCVVLVLSVLVFVLCVVKKA